MIAIAFDSLMRKVVPAATLMQMKLIFLIILITEVMADDFNNRNLFELINFYNICSGSILLQPSMGSHTKAQLNQRKQF